MESDLTAKTAKTAKGIPLAVLVVTVHDSAHAIPDPRHVPVDEESESQSPELQVRHQLGEMNGGERINDFVFHDNPAIHYHVESIPDIQHCLPVLQGDGHRAMHLDATRRKFMRQAILVR